MIDGIKIIDEYSKWIKDNSFTRDVRAGKYCAITTPFQDRHNDHIDIYVSETKNGQFLLSDDGDTISDLAMSGTFPNTQKRKKVLETVINGFSIETDGEELFVQATSGSLPQKKHALIQAILAINDMHMMSQESIWSFFKEDVSAFFLSKDISFVPDIKLAGKSGYDHNIDFMLPRTPISPERIVKTINKANKDQVLAVCFAFSDISQMRQEESEQIIFYNDELEALSNDAQKALIQYDIKHLAWTKREEWAPALLAK